MDQREKRKRKREAIATIALTILFVVLTVAEFRLTRVSATLPFINSIFFFGLLNINVIILIAISWLVLRNVGKLFIERRRKVLGSKLKTKLVISFLGFSIIPTLTLFLISAAYINSSFDNWFSIKIQNTFQASLEITKTFYENSTQTALHFAEHIAKGLAHTPVADRKQYLAAQRELLALDAVEFYPDPLDERILSERIPPPNSQVRYPRLPLGLLESVMEGENLSQVQYIGVGDIIRTSVPVVIKGVTSGVLVVNSFLPLSLNTMVGEIESVSRDYRTTNPLKYPIKTFYFVILVMITLVILFVAIWIGLFWAKELTVPLQKLVHGAQAVGAGNLDVTISGQGSGQGNDEIAVLVESFNKMTHDLRDNRARLNETSKDLERRRLQLEAVLANVGTGVLVVERSGAMTTVNRAAAQLLGFNPQDCLGKNYTALLGDDSKELLELIAQSIAQTHGGGIDRPNITQWSKKGKINERGEMESDRTLAAIATTLNEAYLGGGVVVVIDDMTHLIKGQREMAWREVARRIAHEIKNPLTPIKLSAQRLQRRMSGFQGKEAELLQECTETIIKHADELKEMVNEFSNFARFPEISPSPNDLNNAIKEVVTLYVQAHPEIEFKADYETKLPIFEFDRDQIKRVMINLFDNAVSATTETSAKGVIKVRTHHHEQLGIAVIEIQDNGPGMSDEVLARVFEPYFSTKKEGTGLGLAIVKRIINDHDGFIRVHSTEGKGTQFVIELPTRIRVS